VKRFRAGLAGVITGCLMLGACANSDAQRPPQAQRLPHIMVVVMENEGYRQVIGNTAAPYINFLARTYLRATNSYAHAHFSLPNYLDMISGYGYQSSGTHEDCTPSSCGPIVGTTIGSQLEAAKIS
jgi:phosphatidylinositol-3-phosphatase